VIGPIIVAAGFLLALRIGSEASYWTGVLPAMLVIAVGMAGAVAPLTTAVLMSVDSHHVGAASGLNSAVARTGGLTATALIGSVMSAAGPALVSAFGVATLVGRGALRGRLAKRVVFYAAVTCCSILHGTEILTAILRAFVELTLTEAVPAGPASV